MLLESITQNMGIADTIDAAADLIKQDGWCKNSFKKGSQHCMMGAIAEIECFIDNDDAWRTVATYFGDEDKAFEWNDAQHSQGAVIKQLRTISREVRGDL